MTHSVYIHIPFCSDICSYCDFCKIFYNDKLVDSYLSELETEIKSRYKNEIINTIYIGGGTPSSLNSLQLKKLFNILKIFKTEDLEFTFECNIENISLAKLKLLKKNGVNRISVGVQTLNEKYINLLNRHHNKKKVQDQINLIKQYFNNINIDLIYAIPGQTIEELDDDLEFVLKLDIEHISTYSLIIEEHTKLFVDGCESLDEDLDSSMYKHICKKLEKCGFSHYEISNFAKKGFESKHNLVYWNNMEYYGFGLGASGYINNVRYDNTRSLNKYLKGIHELSSHSLIFNEIVENEFILGLRKIKGINKQDFFRKYNFNIYNYKNVKEMLNNKRLIDDGDNIYINPEFIYTSNNILINFLD